MFLNQRTDKTKKLISELLRAREKNHTSTADAVAGQVLGPEFQKR